jgi:hypothetical protein
MRTRPGTRGIAIVAACNAIAAAGGAIALATGVIDLGDELTQRLPLASPVLGGIALALVVALPAALLAVLAWRGDPRTAEVAIVSGALLVGWIVVEVGFLRALSWLQPTYVVIGVGLALAGRRAQERQPLR